MQAAGVMNAALVFVKRLADERMTGNGVIGEQGCDWTERVKPKSPSLT